MSKCFRCNQWIDSDTRHVKISKSVKMRMCERCQEELKNAKQSK